jgi:hypothetical protein
MLAEAWRFPQKDYANGREIAVYELVTKLLPIAIRFVRARPAQRSMKTGAAPFSAESGAAQEPSFTTAT